MDCPECGKFEIGMDLYPIGLPQPASITDLNTLYWDFDCRYCGFTFTAVYQYEECLERM